MAAKPTAYEERLLTTLRQNSTTGRRQTDFKGPFRVLRLCVLGICLPSLILLIVLHMRYQVYTEQMYPLAASDMRLLDSRISTAWCQRQLIRANTTFNAFLLPRNPALEPKTKPLTMVRHLLLEDDTKEYWGFYLLRGSTVTLSTCVRWPGASLIVIRGHKHLHECAYIGDDSSEELDEILEALEDGTYVRPNSTEDDAPSNQPQLMKRFQYDVEFHHPFHNSSKTNHTILNKLDDAPEITDNKQLKIILDHLYAKARAKAAKKRISNKSESESESVSAHVHRNSTIANEEKKNFRFVGEQQSATKSEEVMQDVLRKLQTLGQKGSSILDKINERFNSNGTTQEEKVLSIGSRHYSKPPVAYDTNVDEARRRRREVDLKSSMAVDLNEHDEENDAAIEEGFIPDGLADHRGTINETTLNDKSNSEFWSSFSSSEEALLNCAGLILNLPLTPHVDCSRDTDDVRIEDAYLANTITYKVPTNGYYFFVFNSENEVQTNYIRVRFNIHKKVYNVSNPVAACSNTTEFCALDLKFFSDEKLVMELPVKDDEDMWNQEFVVVSQCEPRTSIYIVCVLAVPILVILFAFQ